MKTFGSLPVVLPTSLIAINATLSLAATLSLITILNPSPALAQAHRGGSSTTPTNTIPNYCETYESLFVTAQTDNFFVNICGGHLPSHYVGVDKNTGNSIRLPLADYDPSGSYFEAINGEYFYILSKTPRGNFLTVTQGTQELLREYTWDNW